MSTDFYEITPCGGNCMTCCHYNSGECSGCLENRGKCVKMWEEGCYVFRCCKEHNAAFCGLCGEFPCDYVKEAMSGWHPDIIKNMTILKEEYHSQHRDFENKLPPLWESIGSCGVMTISACSHSRVTSRPVSVVVIDGKFYFQTDIRYLKCRQIKENPNIALSFRNFSIEGRCRIMDKPVMHRDFIKSMTEHFPSAVTRYSGVDTERVLEITPTLIYLWEYENDKPYMEYYDFRNDTYRKVEM